MLASGRLAFTPGEQMLLFLAFFVAFAIKVPLFPLHTWLPDAHVEAPSAGSVMLASVMLKMGTYGILHFCLPLFPARRAHLRPVDRRAGHHRHHLRRAGGHGAAQHEETGGLLLGEPPRVSSSWASSRSPRWGSMARSTRCSTTAFRPARCSRIVGLLYERRHSLAIDDYGGVATAAPWLSTAFLITTLASIGLPTLNNFVGEFLVLQGTALANYTWTVWAAIGVILSACYMLWLYQRVFYGEVNPEVRSHVFDLNRREWAAIVPLIAMMVWMGVYSQSFLPPVGKVTAQVLDQTQVNVPFRVQVLPRGRPRSAPRCDGRPPMPVSVASASDLLRFLPEIILTVMGTAPHGARPARPPPLVQRCSAISASSPCWPPSRPPSTPLPTPAPPSAAC